MLHRYRQRHTRSLGDLFISLWNRVDSIRGHRSHVSTSHTKPIHFTKTNLLLLCGNMNDSLFVCPAPLWMRTAMRWCVDEICTGYLYISFQCFPLIFFFVVSRCRRRTTSLRTGRNIVRQWKTMNRTKHTDEAHTTLTLNRNFKTKLREQQ